MRLAVRHNLQLYDGSGTERDEAEALVLPIAEAEAVMGETVSAYLARVAWRFDLPTVCRINGEYYARAEWPERALAINDNVEFVSRPLGPGGGNSAAKSIGSVVALVALTALAPYATAALGTWAGTASALTFAGKLVSAALVGAGALAVSFFLRPKTGGKSAATEQLYAFALGGNQARPLQPIPVLNGRLKFAPDFAAPTYSEYSGDAMIDYGLFALTCKRMQVEQVLVGDTPIWDHETGYNPDYPGIEIQIVEPGEQVTLYPVNVVTASGFGGAELTTAFSSSAIVNAAGTQAKELLFDLVWPGGAYLTKAGETKSRPAITGVEIQARPVDAAGAPAGAWFPVLSKSYTQNKQSQIRITERVTVAPGRYEIRARRTTPPFESGGSDKYGGTDTVTLTAIRAHIEGPQSFPRVQTLAVKGIANKQNSGISGGQLKVIGTRVLPVWENGAFVEKPSRSIAWAALDWWRDSDYGGGQSLTNLDFQAFVAYDALWTSLGHTFDYRFTEVQNLDDVLETILKAGRAFPAPVGDKLTITREEPRGLPRMLFTENDILKDTLEIDYALSDQSWADGMVGEYLDETTWRLAEVSSAPDDVILLKPARVQLQGVVNRKQATGMIRFMAAESQYRRITVDWTARIEGRLLKRGDLVKLSAEEPETWGQSAEVVTVGSDGRSLILDPPPIWTPGANHYVEIRQRDARPWGPIRVSRGSDDAVAVIDAGAIAAVEQAQHVSLADALARRATQERPWLAFSEGQPRTFPALVTSGDPDQDGEHIHLSGVIDAPEVYAIDEAGVAPLPIVPDLYSSALPVIVGLGARITQQQLVLVLTAGWRPALNAVSYVAQVTYDGGTTWIEAYRGDASSFSARVAASDAMKVRVAGITAAGVPGRWYVAAVVAPDLTILPAFLGDLSIDIEKLSAEAQKQIASIAELGQGLLAQDPYGGLGGLGGLDTAHDTIRGALRQLQEYVERFADTAANQATNDFLQREVLKVGTSANYAAIERETVLRSSQTESLASQFATLAAQLTALGGQVTAQASALSGLSAQVTNIDGRVISQSQALTALTGRVDSAELNISGQATATQALTTRVTVAEGNVTSNGAAITSLQSSVASQGGQISGNTSAITNLQTLTQSQGNAITSQGQAITALTSRVDRAELNISGQATATQALTTRVTVAEGNVTSNGAAITSLQSSVASQGGQISGNTSAITNLQTLTQSQGDTITSQGQAITNLRSTVSTQGGQIGGNASAINSLGTRVSNNEGSISSQATSLQALNSTVGSHTATLTTYGSSFDGIKVQFGVTGYVDGATGGFVFTGVKKLDGSVSFTVAIHGSLVVTGSIAASALDVLTVSSITANLGTITTGRIQSPDGLMVSDYTNSRQIFYQP